MANKIQTNKRFEKDLTNIYHYIAESYGTLAADKFFEKVIEKKNYLLMHPEFGRPSLNKASIRKINIGKYNKIYYRLSGNRITLVRLLDNRKDPKKNKYE